MFAFKTFYESLLKCFSKSVVLKPLLYSGRHGLKVVRMSLKSLALKKKKKISRNNDIPNHNLGHEENNSF